MCVVVRWRRSASIEEREEEEEDSAASVFSERTRMAGTPLIRFNNILLFPSGVNLRNGMA